VRPAADCPGHGKQSEGVIHLITRSLGKPVCLPGSQQRRPMRSVCACRNSKGSQKRAKGKENTIHGNTSSSDTLNVKVIYI
jgi:hypothetical protein